MIQLKKISQKVVVLLLLIGIVFPLVPPKRAYAVVPVVDPSLVGQATITAQSTLSIQLKETILDGIVFALINTLVSIMSQQMVEWINSGFDGNPGFVTDPKGLFASAANNIAADFIDELGFGFLCDSFSLGLQYGLSFDFGFGGGGYTSSGACTFNDIFENVASGEIADLNAFYNIAIEPNNNPYGSYLNAERELALRVSAEQKNLDQQLAWGSGFLSDLDVNGYIETPGAFVESQLNNAIDSGSDRLEIADEISEIIGALMNTLMNTAFNGLANATGGSGSYSFNTPSFIRDSDNNSTSNSSDGLLNGDDRTIPEYDVTPYIPDIPSYEGPGGALPGRANPFNVARDQVAYFKPGINAWQSYGLSWSAEFAIDGVMNSNGTSPYTYLDSNKPTIAVPQNSAPDIWWEVDLQGEHIIDEVRVYLRTDDGGAQKALGYGGLRFEFYDNEYNLVHSDEVPSTEIGAQPNRAPSGSIPLTPFRYVRLVRIPPVGAPANDTNNAWIWLAEAEVYGWPTIDSRVNPVNLALKSVGGIALSSGIASYIHPTSSLAIDYPPSNIIDNRTTNTGPATDSKMREPWPSYAAPGATGEAWFSVLLSGSSESPPEPSIVYDVKIHTPTGEDLDSSDNNLFVILGKNVGDANDDSRTVAQMQADPTNFRVLPVTDIMIAGGAPYTVNFDEDDYFETTFVRLQRSGSSEIIGLGEFEVNGKLAPRP